MSAARWLAFTVGVVVVAAVGSLLNEFVLPLIDVMNSQSTTQASSTGIQWYATAWEWMPLVILLLLGFTLIVGIIVRRRQTLT